MRKILVVLALLFAFACFPARADDAPPTSPSACTWLRDFRTGSWQCMTCADFGSLSNPRRRCTQPQELTADGRCRVARLSGPEPQELVISPSAVRAENVTRCDTGGETNINYTLAVRMIQAARIAGVDAPYLQDLELELEGEIAKIMFATQSREEWNVTFMFYYWRLSSNGVNEIVLPSGVILSVGFHTWDLRNAYSGYQDPKSMFLILTSPDYKFQVRAKGVRSIF